MLEQEGRLLQQQLSDAHKAKEHATTAHNKTQEVHKAHLPTCTYTQHIHKAHTSESSHVWNARPAPSSPVPLAESSSLSLCVSYRSWSVCARSCSSPMP